MPRPHGECPVLGHTQALPLWIWVSLPSASVCLHLLPSASRLGISVPICTGRTHSNCPVSLGAGGTQLTVVYVRDARAEGRRPRAARPCAPADRGEGPACAPSCRGGPGPGGGRPVHDTQPGPGGVPVTPGRRSVPTATPSLRSVPPGVSLSRQRTRGTAAGPRLPAPDRRARAVRASAAWVSGVPCAKGSRSSRHPPGGGCRVQHARHRLKEQGHPALPGGAPACSWRAHWPSWGRAL